MSFRETKLVLVSADLAGYRRAVASLGALEVAELLDDWYRRAARVLRGHGGRVVKYMGDACLAVFPEEKCEDAVLAVLELQTDIAQQKPGSGLDMGANIHLAVVAEGEFGPEGDCRYDVLGSGVNHLFSMGAGAGVRISERVYRRLQSDHRRPWEKNRPPATYSLSRSRSP